MTNTIKLIHSFRESAWQDRDYEAVQNLCSVKMSVSSPLGVCSTADMMMHYIEQWLNGLHNQQVEKEYFFDSSKNMVINQWSAQGLHYGEFLGMPPTKGLINYSGINMYGIKNDQIVSYDSKVDLHSILYQMQRLSRNSEAIEGLIGKIRAQLFYLLKVQLTKQEIKVLTMWVGGVSAKEIAIYLKISYRTVELHVQNFYRKLGKSFRGETRELLYTLKLYNEASSLCECLIKNA